MEPKIIILGKYIYIDVFLGSDKDVTFSKFLDQIGFKEIYDSNFTPIGWKYKLINNE